MRSPLSTVTRLALLLAGLAVYWFVQGRSLFAATLVGMSVLYFLMRPLIRWGDRRVSDRHAARRAAELGIPNAYKDPKASNARPTSHPTP